LVDVLLEFGTLPETYEGVLFDEAKIHVLEKEDPLKEEYGDVIFYLNSREFLSGLELQQKTRLQQCYRSFIIIENLLYHIGRDGVHRRVLSQTESQDVLQHCHDGLCGGYFALESTSRKILDARYY
jgi:hypothetical protein